MLNFCANNYLGLADHPGRDRRAKATLVQWGFGMASMRFICGGTAWSRAALRGKAQELRQAMAPRTRQPTPAQPLTHRR